LEGERTDTRINCEKIIRFDTLFPHIACPEKTSCAECDIRLCPDNIDFNQEEREEWERKCLSTLLTNYCGGCGEIYFFLLAELPMNQAFLSWDLD